MNPEMLVGNPADPEAPVPNSEPRQPCSCAEPILGDEWRVDPACARHGAPEPPCSGLCYDVVIFPGCPRHAPMPDYETPEMRLREPAYVAENLRELCGVHGIARCTICLPPEPSGVLVPVPSVKLTAKDLAERISAELAAEYQRIVAEREAKLGGVPPVTADVAGEVVWATAAAEELDLIASRFADLAGQAREYCTNAALSVGTSRLVVPDGETEIVVAPDSKSKTWVEPEPIRDVVAAGKAANFGALLEESGVPREQAETLMAAYLAGGKDVWDEFLILANPSWRTTALGGLRQDLMRHGNNEQAAAIERAYGKTTVVGESLKVTREALKKGRRL